MTASTNSTDEIVDQLADTDGVLQDDIHVNNDTVTTYIPTDKLDAAHGLEGIEVEVLEEYDHEYLISAKASST